MLRKKALMVLLAFGLAMAFNPGVSHAKAGDDQDQIILLNDSAAALEDSNPDLSKKLTQFADEKEKQWEAEKSANSNQPPAALTDKDMAHIQERIELLESAVPLIEPTYPLIAKALKQMAKEMNRAIELEK